MSTEPRLQNAHACARPPRAGMRSGPRFRRQEAGDNLNDPQNGRPAHSGRALTVTRRTRDTAVTRHAEMPKTRCETGKAMGVHVEMVWAHLCKTTDEPAKHVLRAQV